MAAGKVIIIQTGGLRKDGSEGPEDSLHECKKFE